MYILIRIKNESKSVNKRWRKMNFENINSRLQEIWNTTPANFWWVLIVLVIALLIFFLPVKIASSRGLSGGQIFGVFLATIFGFWFLGLILALVLPRSV